MLSNRCCFPKKNYIVKPQNSEADVCGKYEKAFSLYIQLTFVFHAFEMITWIFEMSLNHISILFYDNNQEIFSSIITMEYKNKI